MIIREEADIRDVIISKKYTYKGHLTICHNDSYMSYILAAGIFVDNVKYGALHYSCDTNTENCLRIASNNEYFNDIMNDFMSAIEEIEDVVKSNR